MYSPAAAIGSVACIGGKRFHRLWYDDRDRFAWKLAEADFWAARTHLLLSGRSNETEQINLDMA